jgi:hypothetical protein
MEYLIWIPITIGAVFLCVLIHLAITGVDK